MNIRLVVKAAVPLKLPLAIRTNENNPHCYDAPNRRHENHHAAGRPQLVRPILIVDAVQDALPSIGRANGYEFVREAEGIRSGYLEAWPLVATMS